MRLPGGNTRFVRMSDVGCSLKSVDTANLLINVNLLLVWYPSINKFRSTKPSYYAVVETKISKRFAGEWVSLLSGVRVYALSGHWTVIPRPSSTR